MLRWEEERRRVLAKLEELERTRELEAQEWTELTSAGEAGGENELRLLGQEARRLHRKLNWISAKLEQALLALPNLPDASVPPGKDDPSNVEVKRWGDIPRFEFRPRPHWELGPQLGLWDEERAAKLVGRGFVTLKRTGARLRRALVDFLLDVHVDQHKYTELSPPLLTKRESLTGTGQLPRMEAGMYRTSPSTCKELFLSPSGEVPLVNLHCKEVLNASLLPLCYVAHTLCFRRQAGAHGKASRGLVRLHQFDKVDLVKLVLPEQSDGAFRQLLMEVESAVQQLELPYRIMALCSGRLSFAASSGYAVEVWASGMARYVEVASCDHFREYQARRAGIRYRLEGGRKLGYVHTMNASALGVPRTIAAIVENNQTAQGRVVVPSALRRYMGGLEALDHTG